MIKHQLKKTIISKFIKNIYPLIPSFFTFTQKLQIMRTAIIIIASIIVILFALYAYYGGFRKISFELADAGGEVLVYESLTGDYKHSGKAIDRIYYSLLEKDGIETFKGFGIYYDNPKKDEKAKLRSDVGCILENPDEETIEKLSEKYNIKTLPEQKYLVAEIPYKGKLSIFMGIMRVYPAMENTLRMRVSVKRVS